MPPAAGSAFTAAPSAVRSSATPSPTAPWSLGLTTAMTDSGDQAPLDEPAAPAARRHRFRRAAGTRAAARSGAAARSPPPRPFPQPPPLPAPPPVPALPPVPATAGPRHRAARATARSGATARAGRHGAAGAAPPTRAGASAGSRAPHRGRENDDRKQLHRGTRSLYRGGRGGRTFRLVRGSLVHAESSHRRRRRGGRGRHSDACRRAAALRAGRAAEAGPSRIGRASRRRPRRAARPIAQTAAVPTGAVTSFHAGQTITVTINETTFHPGHYRVVLSTTGQGGLPADPTPTPPGTCESLAIQDPPVFPVLADGVLPHVDPLDGPQSFQVTLPDDARVHALHAAGSGVHVRRGGRQRRLLLSPLRGHLDRGRPGGRDAGGGCATAARGASLGGLLVLLVVLVVAGLRSRARAMLGAAVLISAASGGSRRLRRRSGRRRAVGTSPGDVEQVWLARVGTGPAQTTAVCARGAADPIARALCQSPAPALGGLADLYRALRPVPGTDAGRR